MQIPKNMTDNVDLSVEYLNWNTIDIAHIAQIAIRAVFNHHKISDDWGVSILACDDEKIKSLNEDFRNKDKATNVLSWPEFDIPVDKSGDITLLENSVFGENALGDIAIAYDTCLSEANSANISLEHHCTHLLIHGCLHLLGYDHETDADATRMEGLESHLLVKMGIKDPYNQIEL